MSRIEELQALYATYTLNELRKLASQPTQLTEEAQTALREELDRRDAGSTRDTSAELSPVNPYSRFTNGYLGDVLSKGPNEVTPTMWVQLEAEVAARKAAGKWKAVAANG